MKWPRVLLIIGAILWLLPLVGYLLFGENARELAGKSFLGGLVLIVFSSVGFWLNSLEIKAKKNDPLGIRNEDD